MVKTGRQEPRKRFFAPLYQVLFLLLIVAAGTSVTAATRTAVAQTKSCGVSVGLWPDGAPQCLNDANIDGAAGDCCCRQSPPGVDPEIWTGECTLYKGGLVIQTSGIRLDHADGRRELVEGEASMKEDPNWQGDSLGTFRLEILGGAELTTKGGASAVLAHDGSKVALRADFGQAVLTHRRYAITLVVEPGLELDVDPSYPETWLPQAEGKEGSEPKFEATGCSAQPRHMGGGLPYVLLLFVPLVLIVARRSAGGVQTGRGRT